MRAHARHLPKIYCSTTSKLHSEYLAGCSCGWKDPMDKWYTAKDLDCVVGRYYFHLTGENGIMDQNDCWVLEPPHE